MFVLDALGNPIKEGDFVKRLQTRVHDGNWPTISQRHNDPLNEKTYLVLRVAGSSRVWLDDTNTAYWQSNNFVKVNPVEEVNTEMTPDGWQVDYDVLGGRDSSRKETRKELRGFISEMTRLEIMVKGSGKIYQRFIDADGNVALIKAK